jgi:hypothetical protein
LPPRKVERFKIRTSLGEQPFRKAETPGAVLSKALNQAAANDAEPGVWEVMEYDDVIYRVHRLEGPRLDVRVEVVRA